MIISMSSAVPAAGTARPRPRCRLQVVKATSKRYLEAYHRVTPARDLEIR